MRYSVSPSQACVSVSTVLACCVLLWLGRARVERLQAASQILRVYDDYSTDVVVTEPPQEVFTEEELIPADKLDLPTESYKFHPSCKCSRQGVSLSHLEERFASQTGFWSDRLSRSPLVIPRGVYIGHSTCDRYTSALGSGQQVLSYTYYSPWRTVKKQYMENGKPTETEERFLELLQPLANTARTLYSGWRMRIYHNITEEDTEAFSTFCSLYCENEFIDFCDARNLPDIGDLNTHFPIGRFWRFQVLADWTVSVFGSRDVDSYLTPRERAAVGAWLVSGKQFHVMRDGPFHRSTILAGLWGANNYHNLSMAASVKAALLGVQPNLYKFYDQRILHSRVWPVIRDFSAIYDSYNCGIIWKFGHCRPWPTKREGFRYVGYGPTKNYAVKALRRKRCPVKCRPEAHKDWEYC